MEPLELLFKGDEEEVGAGTSDDEPDGVIVSVAATVAADADATGWPTVVDADEAAAVDAEVDAVAKLGDDDSNELLDTVVDVLAVVAATKQG